MFEAYEICRRRHEKNVARLGRFEKTVQEPDTLPAIIRLGEVLRNCEAPIELPSGIEQFVVPVLMQQLKYDVLEVARCTGHAPE